MSWENKVQNLLGHCTRDTAFGSDLIYTPPGGSAQGFQGIWSNTYLQIDPNDGIPIMSNDPSVGVRVSDLNVYPVKGGIITRNAQNYIVRAVEPDGEGGAVLVLEKQK